MNDEASGPTQASHAPRVVGLGGSAGGLYALQEFFQALPSQTGAAYVVVVHLSPDFKSFMPELLAKHTDMPVRAATDGTRLQPDHVYIIPPGQNMVLVEDRLALRPQDRKPGHALNLPIDIFFSSLAEELPGQKVTAVIVSGTGSDGSRGLVTIKDAGGVVLVQAPDTARFDGMVQGVVVQITT